MEEISWSGEGPGSQWSPLLFDIVTPRRSTTMTRGPGEGSAGLAGRDEPRRDWQGQNARSASQLLSSPVWIGLALGTRTFDLLTVGLGDLGGAYLEPQEEETEVSQSIFRTRTDSCHASTLARQFPQKKYGAENIGPVGLGTVVTGRTGNWDWDWALLGSAWMEEAHLIPKGERRTKQDGRGRNERRMGRHRAESVGRSGRVTG